MTKKYAVDLVAGLTAGTSILAGGYLYMSASAENREMIAEHGYSAAKPIIEANLPQQVAGLGLLGVGVLGAALYYLPRKHEINVDPRALPLSREGEQTLDAMIHGGTFLK